MNLVFVKPTVGQFLNFCKESPDLVVNVKPTGNGSWRGRYAEACIFCDFYSGATLSEFIPYLQNLVSGVEFIGYKGGEYYYDKRTDLNFECQGSSYTESGNFEKFVLNSFYEVDKELLKVFINEFKFYGDF